MVNSNQIKSYIILSTIYIEGQKFANYHVTKYVNLSFTKV
jgi:hypothetical protein